MGAYYVVYDPSGRQRGHVWIDDIEKARKERPDHRFEINTLAMRTMKRAEAKAQTKGLPLFDHD